MGQGPSRLLERLPQEAPREGRAQSPAAGDPQPAPRHPLEADPQLIAKVDASIVNKFKTVGQYWLVPVIAKVDALKVNIFEVPIR